MRIESIYICVWLNKYFLAFLYLFLYYWQGGLYSLSADTQIYRIYKIYSKAAFLRFTSINRSFINEPGVENEKNTQFIMKFNIFERKKITLSVFNRYKIDFLLFSPFCIGCNSIRFIEYTWNGRQIDRVSTIHSYFTFIPNENWMNVNGYLLVSMHEEYLTRKRFSPNWNNIYVIK